MEEINYPRYNEVLYTTVLANGLRVNLLPRKNFHKTYGVLTTDYGSIDNTFIPYGKEELIKVPDGIAHFLEHKMFEKQDHDAFDLFVYDGTGTDSQRILFTDPFPADPEDQQKDGRISRK